MMSRALFLIALVWSSALLADPLKQFQTFTDSFQRLQANFVQTPIDAKGVAGKPLRGSVWLAKPNQFRMDYAAPYAQQVVADGQSVWTYDVELEQVSVRPQGPVMQSTPLQLLLDATLLNDRFVAKAGKARNSRLESLELKPKGKAGADEAGFQKAVLWLENNRLVEMQLHDNFGQRTRIEFRNVQLNTAIPAARFAFKVPAGVDVIGELPKPTERAPIN
jgi:outer membrane lipoprotein carrier protein